MGQKVLTELERNNKIAMIAHLLDSFVILLFCLLRAQAGLDTWLYFLIAAVLGLGPVAAEIFFWKKDKATPTIKHLAAVGFAVFYTFIMFTASNSLVFAFAIPMIMVVSVYNDIQYAIKINIGTVLESLIVVIVGSKTGKFGFTDMDTGIIQITVMILTAIYAIMTARTLNRNTKQRVKRVEEAQNKTELVLNDISNLSEKLKQGIEEISGKLESLDKASVTTKDAMEEVSTGATETAEAVQSQLLQTEAIQNKVDIVDDAAIHITENMQQTLEVLESGKQDMELLVGKVEASVENGADVAEKLKMLDQYMEEMNSIVEIINGITSQTTLLALNASIEAARAGEAGKGFAVVATEITGMAAQTDEATVHITDLIQNVSTAIGEVVNVIYQMIEGINEEKQEAANTAQSFEAIEKNTFAIRDNMEHLAKNIDELKSANHVIMESIQTISAISEQVSAHANMTMGAEEENAAVLGNIAAKMQELVVLINRSES